MRIDRCRGSGVIVTKAVWLLEVAWTERIAFAGYYEKRQVGFTIPESGFVRN